MNIHEIKGILSSYVSEKGLDLLSSKVWDLLERKEVKEYIAAEIKKAQSDFEKASRNEEFDFQGLIELVKGFNDKDFIITYTILFSEPDKLEKAKKQIFDICIRDTHANAPDAKSNVKHILDNCFSIVEESLKSKLKRDDWIQIGLINKHTDENTQKIIDNSNQNTKEIINAIKENSASQNSSSTQPEKKEPTNDNDSYLKTFSELLFLEDDYEDENVVSLADMYISPSIQGKDIKASECVKKWYNTKTKPCLLLYGNAGVGKSSLVAKILADANGITEKDKVEFDFDSSKVMAVALRNHTDEIDNELTAKEILTKLFNSEQLKDKLLILDGLDELCVLKHGFDGEKFLEKLSSLEYGYHVLVTSRESESYFTEPHDEEGLRTEHLVWEERQINDWLELYKAQKPRKEEWCTKFHEQLCSLETYDKRREIFCVPIILYICGTSKTDIEDHSSIGSIYRDAFTKILLRKHLRGQSNTDKFEEADKEANMTAWQFTKELAYQMFLLDTLDLVDDNTSNGRRAVGFRNAKKRTKDILKEEYGIKEPNLELKRELAVCPFAKENGQGGITFAHKTIYEYFTAVKLYEDYFAKFDEKYFNTKADDTAAMYVMESFIEAFRYVGITDDIFSYLCKMKVAPFSTTLGYSESQGLDYKKYEQKFVYGMQNHMYAKFALNNAIDEYLYYNEEFLKYNSINAQISTAYANFTWFLSKHGFTNDKKIPECKLIGNFLHNSLKTACFKKWHLEGADLTNTDLAGANLIDAYLTDADLRDADLRDADLTYANLRKANLSSADLTYAHLSYAHLEEANLERAHLKEAHLKEAHLKRAILYGADLISAYLSGADLSGAELGGAYLINADLSGAELGGAEYYNGPMFKTIFPEGFDPKAHGMIEVNMFGIPVEDE